jgi:hypothetical protein
VLQLVTHIFLQIIVISLIFHLIKLFSLLAFAFFSPTIIFPNQNLYFTSKSFYFILKSTAKKLNNYIYDKEALRKGRNANELTAWGLWDLLLLWDCSWRKKSYCNHVIVTMLDCKWQDNIWWKIKVVWGKRNLYL